MRGLSHLLTASVCLTLSLAPAIAADTPAPKADPPADLAAATTPETRNLETTPAATSGMVVIWNAEKGQMEPARAERLAELAEALRADLAERLAGTAFGQVKTDAEPEILPNGMKRLRLGLEHLSFSKVDLHNGKAEMMCVDDPRAVGSGSGEVER